MTTPEHSDEFEKFMDRYSTMKPIGQRTLDSFKGYTELDIWQAARAPLLAEIERLRDALEATARGERAADQQVERLQSDLALAVDALEAIKHHQEMVLITNTDAMRGTTWHIAVAALSRLSAYSGKTEKGE